MNRSTIENIIAEHYKNISRHTKCFATDMNADAVHLFRVEYKKLRALIRMLNANEQHHKNSSAVKKLKNLFHLSGAIRDVQLQQRLVASAVKKPLQKPRAYLDVLQQQYASLKSPLKQLPIKKSIVASKAKTLQLLPHKFGTAKFMSFFKTKKNEVVAIITAGNFSDGDLHRIRKILKDLYYNVKVYQKYAAVKHHARLKEGATHLEELLKTLGIFHDKCVAISLLQPYPKIQTEKLALQQIKKSWQKEKLQLKSDLVKKLSTEKIVLP